jgi:hypothetical protein
MNNLRDCEYSEVHTNTGIERERSSSVRENVSFFENLSKKQQRENDNE